MIFGFPKFGNGISFARIAAFLDAEGIDIAEFSGRSLVITGSKGKGSTSLFAARALEAAGYRVGLFTSPHLVDIRERFYAAGHLIAADELESLVAGIRRFDTGYLQPDGDGFGAFEVLFLAALQWFRTQRLDYIVWEAGLGGRYDPVRTLRAPVAALTSVELEHADLLGATTELIAYDKLDAVRPGGTTIISASVPEALRKRIEAYTALRGFTPVFASSAMPITDAEISRDGTSFTALTDGAHLSISLAMIGRHQASNAVAALLGVETLLGDGASRQHLLAGIANARLPGRLERISTAPEIWIDVGHTPDSIRATIETITALIPREKLLAVFGVSAKKEVAAITALVSDAFDDIIVTRAYKNGADPDVLANGIVAQKRRAVAPSIERAAETARSVAETEDKAVLVVGGLFLAIEFQQAFLGRDPRSLNFF